MKSELIKWRVQTRNATTRRWKNRGLFETRNTARLSARLYRTCRACEGKVFLEPFGFGNTRVARHAASATAREQA